MADDLDLDLDLELEDHFDEYIPQPPISTKKEKKKKPTFDQNTEEESHNPGVIEVTDVAEIQNEDLELNEANQSNQEQVDVGEQLASQFGFEENSQISASYNQENYNPLVGSYQVDSFQESLQESPSFGGHVGQGDAFSASLQGLQSFDMSQSLNVGGPGLNGQNLNQLNNIQALKPSLNETATSQLNGTGDLRQVENSNLDVNGNKISSSTLNTTNNDTKSPTIVPPVSARPRTPGCEATLMQTSQNSQNSQNFQNTHKSENKSINTSKPPLPIPSFVQKPSSLATIPKHQPQNMQKQAISTNHQRRSNPQNPQNLPSYRKVGDDDFDRLCTIGKGGYGKVFQVRKRRGNDAGEIYAMKVISKHKLLRSRTDTQHTRSERKILEAINHPFIVHLKYAFQNGTKLYLVMEYLSGGELFRLLDIEGYLREEWAIFYLAEIVLALGHLHKYGVIYRDLKPENIMLDAKGHIKLTDFGLCKERIFDNAITHTFCGTVDYMAPEIISRDGHSRAADWWSLGALTYDMLTGRPPFTVEGDRRATERNIIEGNIRLPQRLSRESRAFIKQLLVRNTSNRLGGGPGDSLEVRNSTFFGQANIDWQDVFDRRIQPPYQPRLQTKQDTSYFDGQFTNLPPEDSPTHRSMGRSIGVGSYRADDSAFVGFSYDPYGPNMQNTMEAMSPITQRQTIHGYPGPRQSNPAQNVHQPTLSPLTRQAPSSTTQQSHSAQIINNNQQQHPPHPPSSSNTSSSSRSIFTKIFGK